MKLAKLLGADQIILEMKAVEHWPAIVELVNHLVTTEQLPAQQRSEMLEAFRKREEQVSTGIGSGVAIPHAFSDELERVIAVTRASNIASRQVLGAIGMAECETYARDGYHVLVYKSQARGGSAHRT